MTFTDVSLMTIARLPLICWKVRLYQTREARREKDKLDIDLLMQKVRAMAAFVDSYEGSHVYAAPSDEVNLLIVVCV